MADATKTRNKKEVEEDKTGPKNVAEFILVGGVDDIPANRPSDTTFENAIEKAAEALDEKAQVLAKIQDARQLATLLINMGSGDREQVAWARFYLPRKKRRTQNGEEVDVDDE